MGFATVDKTWTTTYRRPRNIRSSRLFRSNWLRRKQRPCPNWMSFSYSQIEKTRWQEDDYLKWGGHRHYRWLFCRHSYILLFRRFKDWSNVSRSILILEETTTKNKNKKHSTNAVFFLLIPETFQVAFVHVSENNWNLKRYRRLYRKIKWHMVMSHYQHKFS